MNLKKSGFTLIELLVTISILGFISSIVYPIINGVMKDTKEKAYQMQIDSIKKASGDWVKMFPSALPDKEGGKISIQLLHLKKAGLIDLDLKNPITKELFPDDMMITITYTKNKYVASIDEKSGSTSGDSIYKGMIVLKGNSHMIEEVNSKNEFVDPGVIGYDENGHIIPSTSVVTMISRDGRPVDNVDMSSIGFYELTYKTSIQGKVAQVKRTVDVKDTTPPIIVIPKNTSISTTVSSIDLMEGVSASDNSLEDISVTVSGNVALHVPGVYVVRYTASDSSGNKREKKRTITVS